MLIIQLEHLDQIAPPTRIAATPEWNAQLRYQTVTETMKCQFVFHKQAVEQMVIMYQLKEVLLL